MNAERTSEPVTCKTRVRNPAQLRRAERVIPIPEMNKCDIERFWTKVDIKADDDCWEWRSAINSVGYGVFRLNGRTIGAHRLSCLIARDEFPGFSLHSCDNRKCVNPAHIRDGSPAENTEDMLARRRQKNRPMPGEENPARRLTDHAALEIYNHYLAGRPQRETAREYGVTQATVNNIGRGRSWSHITGATKIRRMRYRKNVAAPSPLHAGEGL